MEQAREAAKRLVADDGESKARGGPWCRRALPPEDLSEAAAVATCTSRAAVRSLAAKAAFRGGSLACHLAQARFRGGGKNWRGAKRAAAPATFETPPKPKRKPGRSGTQGNLVRRAHLAEPRYDRDSREHLRAHRGCNPKARRKAENARLAEKRLARRRPAAARWRGLDSWSNSLTC